MSFRQNLSPLALTLLLAIPASAAENAIPNFGMDSAIGWVAGVPESNEPIGDDFLPPPDGPGPVVSEKDHPYIDNTYATRTGGQPTFHVADLASPILLPWAREALRKVNERVLAGEPVFTPKERCWPIGVPAFLLYPNRFESLLDALKSPIQLAQRARQASSDQSPLAPVSKGFAIQEILARS